MLLPSLLALYAAVVPVFGGLTGTFQTAGDTQVSGMMVCKTVRIFFISLLIQTSPDVCC